MPGPGDHQRSIANPFAESQLRISEYTAQEIATLQSRLDRQLGPEYISTRPGPGGSKIHYLAADKVINLANEVFGFNGWSSSIQNVQIDFVDDDHGKITLGCSIICRVTLRDGTFHEDIGYGEIRNAPSKSAAFEKAKKQASTDALKRALRNFGNVLGNCLYDKTYLAKVSKVKITPSRWEVDDLHRHPCMGFPKKEPLPLETQQEKELQASMTTITHMPDTGNEFEDEFGQIEDDDLINPDEVCLREENIIRRESANGPEPRTNDSALPAIHGPGPPDAKQMPRPHPVPGSRPHHNTVGSLDQGQGQRMMNSPLRPIASPTANGPPRPMSNVNRGPQEANQISRGPVNHDARLSNSNQANVARIQGARPSTTAEPAQRPPHLQSNPPNQSNLSGSPVRQPQQRLPHIQPQQQQPVVEHKNGDGTPNNHEPPVGFYSARVAETLTHIDPGNNLLLNNVLTSGNLPAFNPRAESGIRRTSGINHTVSGPIKRQSLAGPPAQQNGVSPGPGTNQTPNKSNFINPQADANRRIGMPGALQSPLANRGAYKPPGPALGKRGPEALNRSALGDVTNVQNEATIEENDYKRPKVDDSNQQNDSIGN